MYTVYNIHIILNIEGSGSGGACCGILVVKIYYVGVLLAEVYEW